MSKQSALSVSQARKVRTLFEKGQSPDDIAVVLAAPLADVIALTTERDAIVLRVYAGTGSVERAAAAVGARKAFATAILERHGIARRCGKPPRNTPKPPPKAVKGTFFRQPPAPESAKDFLDLDQGVCRYPFGDVAPFKFCAAPARQIVRGGKQVRDVYCPEHRAICSFPVKLKSAIKAAA